MNRLSLCASLFLLVSPDSLPAYQNVATKEYTPKADTPTRPDCKNPQLVKKVDPVLDPHMLYDRQAIDANIKGPVSYLLEISPNGSVGRFTLVRGNPTLIRAAARAVRQWRYAPVAKTCAVSVTVDVAKHITSGVAIVSDFPADDDSLEREQPKPH